MKFHPSLRTTEPLQVNPVSTPSLTGSLLYQYQITPQLPGSAVDVRKLRAPASSQAPGPSPLKPGIDLSSESGRCGPPIRLPSAAALGRSSVRSRPSHPSRRSSHLSQRRLGVASSHHHPSPATEPIRVPYAGLPRPDCGPAAQPGPPRSSESDGSVGRAWSRCRC